MASLSLQEHLGSLFQTNRRECFYQRDLEEKMVHKVTMDTVKIITSSISGMTNVSSLLIQWATIATVMAPGCMLKVAEESRPPVGLTM